MASFETVSPDPSAGWQAVGYAHLLGQDRAGWAWEWLRRNPEFANMKVANGTSRLSPSIVVSLEQPMQQNFLGWGLHYG